MRMAQNEKGIQEVITFIQTGWPENRVTKIDRVISIDDFSLATELAWRAVYEEGESTWTDIRQHECAEVDGLAYAFREYREVEDEFRSKFNQLSYKTVERWLPKIYEEISEEVFVDLYHCAYARLICGNTNPFHEALFRIYSSGDWPCGWRGNYPAGQLIAFFGRV